MTGARSSDVAPYVPSGRPVHRFVGAVLAVAAVLGLLVVVGPFRAEVSASIRDWRVEDDRAITLVKITNHGRLPVELQGIGGPTLSEPTPLLDDDHATPDHVVAGDSVGTVRVEPDETVTVTAVLAPACNNFIGRATLPFELIVEVQLGLERTVRIHTPPSAGNSVAESACESVWYPS